MVVRKPRFELKAGQTLPPPKEREPEDYYVVTVNAPFLAYETLFQPGQQYHVKAKVFDSTDKVSNDKTFSELCATNEKITM